MRARRRMGSILTPLACGLLLLLATSAAHSAEPVRGFGIVMSRDVPTSTLKIDDTVYRVTPRTVFKDLEGNTIAFETMEIFDVHQGLFALQDATTVEYVARQAKTQWILESVRRVPELPR